MPLDLDHLRHAATRHGAITRTAALALIAEIEQLRAEVASARGTAEVAAQYGELVEQERDRLRAAAVSLRAELERLREAAAANVATSRQHTAAAYSGKVIGLHAAIEQLDQHFGPLTSPAAGSSRATAAPEGAPPPHGGAPSSPGGLSHDSDTNTTETDR